MIFFEVVIDLAIRYSMKKTHTRTQKGAGPEGWGQRNKIRITLIYTLTPQKR